MGVTLALVQSEGHLPVARDFSKISWMTGAISILSTLSTIGLISSKPAALSGHRFDSNLIIPIPNDHAYFWHLGVVTFKYIRGILIKVLLEFINADLTQL